MSGTGFQLKVRTFAGHEKTRSSATLGPDGKRYVFFLNTEEKPAECADVLPNGHVLKGHEIVDGFYDLLMSDCEHCKRPKGKHVRPGNEVRHWLDQMPPACKKFWEETGCNGDGFILIGGDDVQGYVMECAGCPACQTPSAAAGEPAAPG
jgi:hypothetical protein